MRVTTILKESITNAINKKAKTKCNTLKCLLATSEVERSQIIDDTVKDISNQLKPIIDNTIETMLQNHPEIFIESTSRYTNIKTKENLQQHILSELIEHAEVLLRSFLSSNKVKQSKQNLEDFNKYVQETVENTIIELELGTTNKQQVNDLLNNITFK